MNYLQLCQYTAREAGVAAATTSNNVPATVSGNVGELQRVVDYVQQAWLEIQGDKHYDFLREAVTITIPIGASEVAGTVSAQRYIKDSAYYLPTSGNGRFWLDYLDWDYFRSEYKDSAFVAQQRLPTAWSVRRGDNAIVFNCTPVGAAVPVYMERYRAPQVLAADADVPLLPTDLHRLIVEKAKRLYANTDEAGVMRQTAVDEATRLQMILDSRSLPPMAVGDTLLD